MTIGDQIASPTKSPTGITMAPVESSMVDAVGYDEERRLLQVMFTSGRVYGYEAVPPAVCQGLLEAESKGQYRRACIIDVCPYRRRPCRKRWVYCWGEERTRANNIPGRQWLRRHGEVMERAMIDRIGKLPKE